MRRPSDSCLDAFSWREPVSTSLENAMAPSAFLGQQQLAAVLDRGLGHLGKALQQPWQHDFHLHMILCDVDMAGRRLAERANAKNHAVVFPSLLIDAQHRHAGSGARKSRLQAAHGFVASEAVRNGNYQWFSHRKNPLLILSTCNCTQFERKRRGDYRGAIRNFGDSGLLFPSQGRTNTTALPAEER